MFVAIARYGEGVRGMRVDELPLVLTVAEFQRALRIGRAAAYEWARQHPKRVIRFGNRIRIPRTVVAELLGEGGSESGPGGEA
jgi:hypothetical protein